VGKLSIAERMVRISYRSGALCLRGERREASLVLDQNEKEIEF
jgi:hypothetical protein